MLQWQGDICDGFDVIQASTAIGRYEIVKMDCYSYIVWLDTDMTYTFYECCDNIKVAQQAAQKHFDEESEFLRKESAGIFNDALNKNLAWLPMSL